MPSLVALSSCDSRQRLVFQKKNDPRHRPLMMSETELLAIGRGTTEHLVTWFGQMLTITFAMIVSQSIIFLKTRGSR